MPKLISWNVNGIRAAMKKGFLDFVAAEKPDILGLQETKAQPEIVHELLGALPGYHLFNSSAVRKGYSGVCLLSREKPVDVGYSIGAEQFDTEGRIVRADFGKWVLFNIYFPNGGSGPERLAYKMAFYDRFLEVTQELLKQNRRVIVCGDVNTAHHEIDLARPKENRKVSGFLPQECAWVDKFVAAGFIDSFRHLHPETRDAYSWWDMKTGARARNVGWRIDYFFVDQGLKSDIQEAAIMSEVMGSDHCPVRLVLA